VTVRYEPRVNYLTGTCLDEQMIFKVAPKNRNWLHSSECYLLVFTESNLPVFTFS